MNTILIVDASASDSRIMSGLLTRAGYNPVFVDSIEAGKLGAAKLPPGAVVVTAMRLPDGTAREFINWLNAEGYKFPVRFNFGLLTREKNSMCNFANVRRLSKNRWTWIHQNQVQRIVQCEVPRFAGFCAVG